MKIIRHSLFWLATVILLTLIFGRSYGNFSTSFYFVCLLLPLVIGVSYFFNYFLVPKYLFAQRYFKFCLYTFYLILVALNLQMLVITAGFIILAEYNYQNMNPVTSDVFVLNLTLFFVVFLFCCVRLVRFYHGHQKSMKEFKNEIQKTKIEKLLVKENRKNRSLPLDEILYIESLSDYVKIHLEKEEVITKEKISALTQRLPHHFVRVHRSFLVNQIHVKSFNKNEVHVNDECLPIGRTYKENAISSLS